jgi:hypothetical protein
MSFMNFLSECRHGNARAWDEHPVRCPSFETPRVARLLRMRSCVNVLILRSGPQGRVSKDGPQGRRQPIMARL